jgi:hypothetical protein
MKTTIIMGSLKNIDVSTNRNLGNYASIKLKDTETDIEILVEGSDLAYVANTVSGAYNKNRKVDQNEMILNLQWMSDMAESERDCIFFGAILREYCMEKNRCPNCYSELESGGNGDVAICRECMSLQKAI